MKCSIITQKEQDLLGSLALDFFSSGIKSGLDAQARVFPAPFRIQEIANSTSKRFIRIKNSSTVFQNFFQTPVVLTAPSLLQLFRNSSETFEIFLVLFVIEDVIGRAAQTRRAGRFVLSLSNEIHSVCRKK